jgi:hypothetical protein
VTRLSVRKRSRRALGPAVVVLTAALSLLVVPAAQAAIGFEGLSAQPAKLAAGANSDVNIHIGFSDPSDQVKDLTVHLPPGLTGNPTATPQCTVAQLNSDSCPANSQVGSVTAKVNVVAVPGLPAVPQTVNGSLYNLVPPQGEPARFGIVLRPLGGLIGGTNIIQQSAVKLRRTDFGLDTVINNFPTTASGLETDITSLDITLLGTANGKGFMRNPTSCSPATVSFDADSYGGHAVHGSAPSFTPTNCNALDFSPTLSATVGRAGATAAGSNTPLRTVIEQAPTEAGLKSAKVLLPSSLGANSALLTTKPCPRLTFETNAAKCPSKAIVGSAIATSTFLPRALGGAVVLVKPGPMDFLPRLGVSLHGPLSLNILGNFVIESAGQGNAFMKLPDIPISQFILRFHGGKNGLLGTSIDLCNSPPPRFTTSFDGFNGAHTGGKVPATIAGCS